MSWGVYCIETVWEEADSPLSVLPMLDLLKRRWDMPYVHRDAVTTDEFYHHIRKWLSLDDYPILYLGYHGDSNGIWLDETQPFVPANQVLLSSIALALDSACANRVVHFGSCSTVDVGDAAVKKFAKQTGAIAISGFGVDVDWMHSLAFELLYFETVQWKMASDGRFVDLNRDRMMECKRELNRRAYSSLRDELGFNLYIPLRR